MKTFKIKLESISPSGIPNKTENLSMIIDDLPELTDRLYLSIGKCLYSVDRNGHIIDRILPFDAENLKIKKSFKDWKYQNNKL